jgi:hypothetical protein
MHTSAHTHTHIIYTQTQQVHVQPEILQLPASSRNPSHVQARAASLLSSASGAANHCVRAHG